MKSIRNAFSRIEAWMRANGAETIVDNLAPCATDEDLALAEENLGFALPDAVRELWRVHDGQLSEHDGFYEMYDLLSCSAADDDQLPFYVEGSIGSPRAVSESGLVAEEIASKAWLMIAARDSDGVAVNGVTGRVFRVSHDDSPCLYLLAPSVEEWLEDYANAVTNDDYRLEAGFGDVYLSRRDREREASDAELARARTAEERRRAALAPIELMEQAVANKSESMAADALRRTNMTTRDAVMDSLFRGEPSFVATVLRSDLRSLTLSPAQWTTVAQGGKKLRNNAVVAYAEKMAASA
jgi:cell wall assembly regulator SMI1